ncbi:hypothetical protein PT974_07046 [Cladobotryum mycophilum]|uniref:Uncharacterized protein n=1 Tax=Cladobotryum mycophilum TaxID=491253 RepID=A0ABR0SN88_9HYPO
MDFLMEKDGNVSVHEAWSIHQTQHITVARSTRTILIKRPAAPHPMSRLYQSVLSFIEEFAKSGGHMSFVELFANNKHCPEDKSTTYRDESSPCSPQGSSTSVYWYLALAIGYLITFVGRIAYAYFKNGDARSDGLLLQHRDTNYETHLSGNARQAVMPSRSRVACLETAYENIPPTSTKQTEVWESMRAISRFPYRLIELLNNKYVIPASWDIIPVLFQRRPNDHSADAGDLC